MYNTWYLSTQTFLDHLCHARRSPRFVSGMLNSFMLDVKIRTYSHTRNTCFHVDCIFFAICVIQVTVKSLFTLYIIQNSRFWTVYVPATYLRAKVVRNVVKIHSHWSMVKVKFSINSMFCMTINIVFAFLDFSMLIGFQKKNKSGTLSEQFVGSGATKSYVHACSLSECKQNVESQNCWCNIVTHKQLIAFIPDVQLCI